jgi:type VI secretion system secreted protein VgrG
MAEKEKINIYVKTPLDEGDERKFSLQDIEGEEHISGLFHYRLRLKSKDNSIDFSKIVGEGITLVIELLSGDSRYINGIVSSFSQAENDKVHTFYYAEIRPWLWQLTLTSDSRIFQNQTVPQIIEKVFGECELAAYSSKLTGTYAAREYCVQYQETAFDFVSRLMEDEGIFYFFEHEDGSHSLVLADAADAHQACPGLEVAHFRYVLPEWATEDMIDWCTLEQQLIPNKYAVKDFNFETPDTDLTTFEGEEDGNLRLYEYPGGFAKTADGDTIAKKRLEAHELTHKTFKGEGYCCAFIAGFTFTLEGHDRTDMNATYVLRSLTIKATAERYKNTFEAFSAEVPFRAPLNTERPKIFGTQTAIVVGKSGEEIFTDKYGRVKVQFHWDQEGKKDENSSCWVRVAQIWAGKGWGTLFIPRIGTEVIVSFLDGDPDKPIVIGTVYNAKQVVPYGLPGEQDQSTILTRSTKKGEAGNEIRFKDTKDAEELYVHAQKDMSITVENDKIISVMQNRTTTIQEANETLTVEKGDRIIKVNTGNETHEVKGERALTITKDETHTNEAAFTQKVSKDFTLEVKGNLTIDVKGTVTIKAGTSLTNQAGTDLTNKAGTSLTNQAGTDLTNKANMSLTNKANMSLTNEASISLTNKASASQTVDGGGFLNIKGGVVKIN